MPSYIYSKLSRIIELNHLLRSATPSRLSFNPFYNNEVGKEAHAARAGRLLLAAGAAINQARYIVVTLEEFTKKGYTPLDN